jgi:PiT family inorganic phosphate transporter
MGMPVSTTHSIVGAVAGFGVVAAGWDAVEWGKMGQIVASWFISPIAGGVLAFIIFKLISRFILGRQWPTRAAIRVMPFIVCFIVMVVTLATIYKGLAHITEKADWITGPRALLLSLAVGLFAAWLSRSLVARRLARCHELPLSEQLEQVERVFAPLVVLTSCTIAFAHGANDVANAIGPVAAVVDIVRSGRVAMQVHVPFWVLTLGGCGIAVGLGTFGYRVLRTVGEKITQLTPSRGVAADVAACTTVLVCTRLKLPVSTTHTLVGAILGIGLARGLGAVNRKVTKNIFGSWFITVPAAGALAIVFFLLGKAFLLGTVKDVLLSAVGTV